MEMASFISILNNDDNPSFAVRPSLTRHHSSSSYASERTLEQQRPPTSDYGFDPVVEAAQAPSPGSSDCSHDYATSSCGSYFQPNPSDSYTYPPSKAPSENRRSATSVDPPSPQASKESSSSSVSKAGFRKNKYPCPYAGSHGCLSTFTTSGHAARHGKKHTGEKSVHCPICNKAFTRKDNMKQHIRTHRMHSEDMNNSTGGDSSASASTSTTASSGWSRTNPSTYQHHDRSTSQSSRHVPY